MFGGKAIVDRDDAHARRRGDRHRLQHRTGARPPKEGAAVQADQYAGRPDPCGRDVMHRYTPDRSGDDRHWVGAKRLLKPGGIDGVIVTAATLDILGQVDRPADDRIEMQAGGRADPGSEFGGREHASCLCYR